jgi:hypothetical protein
MKRINIQSKLKSKEGKNRNYKGAERIQVGEVPDAGHLIRNILNSNVHQRHKPSPIPL